LIDAVNARRALVGSCGPASIARNSLERARICGIPELQEETLAEQTSEVSHRAKELRDEIKFHPADAVCTALLKEADKFPFVAGWALARLVAWALFDQQESKFIPKGERKNKASRRPFSPRYAYKAGQLWLWRHVRNFFQSNKGSERFRENREITRDAAFALELYFETDEVKKNISNSGSTLSSLHNDKRRRLELMFVYHVMDFLVRANLSGRADVCKAKIALYFAEKIEPMGVQWTHRRIERAWNLYRAAAPYIYVFYSLLYGDDDDAGAFPQEEKITEEDWLSRIARVAERSALEERLGRAAFAADVLATSSSTHDVRVRDFKGVARVRPSLREFDAVEVAIIDSFDDKAVILN
jgi:hypothetical protein